MRGLKVILNVWYSELSNWEAELQEYIRKLRQG